VIILLLIFSVIVVYPVILNPSFKIVEANFIKCEHNNYLWQNVFRTFIVLLTIVVGILSINNFDTLLSLVGSAIAIPLGLIIPSFLHYKLYKEIQSKWYNVLDIFITIIGTGCALAILFFTIVG
jgi:amino acid permease